MTMTRESYVPVHSSGHLFLEDTKNERSKEQTNVYMLLIIKSKVQHLLPFSD